MPDKKALFAAAGGYVRENPGEIVRAARNAVALRFGLPLDALRYLASQARGKRAPKNVEIDAVPPGIRGSATVDLMGTSVRAAASVFIERVSIDEDSVRIEIRLADVSLKVMGESDSPVAALIKSGALDLSRPGNLAAYMPKRPPVLVEAEGDRIVLDLMKHPKLRDNAKAQRIVTLVSRLVAIRAIETDPSHLDVALRAFPRGASDALAALRGAL